MASDAHRRLRAATHDAHQKLEERLGIVERVRSPAGRAAVVGGFHRLHAEIEAAVAPWLLGVAGLEFEARRRTARLEADLRDLGVAVPSAQDGVVHARNVAEALGLMYVLEGSTLGGQVIRRQVADLAGLSFLDPYGARTGERWRSFLSVLETRLRTPETVEAAIAGALAGFAHAERRLCEESVHV